MPSLDELKKWFEMRRAKVREDYFRFLRFRSVSTDPSYAPEMQACAKWLCEYLKRGGLRAEVLPTSGYPLVFAEEKSDRAEAKTLLAYGHYDVQPVDPIEQWESDPFEPVEREGKIFARGTCDDKGQIFYAILAALAWKDLGQKLPVHLKFCIEGEEESQSKGLLQALPSLKEKLSADFLAIVDFGQLGENMPAVTLGARGIAAFEVALTGSHTDLHSGMVGGIAYNPIRALVELLAQLWDAEGRICVPGFYDSVEAEDAKEYTYPYSKEHFAKEFGIAAFGGEKKCSLQEANWLRPTLEINGIGGGYTGAGMKTVIPAKAFAKISMRLVPHQKPEKILRAVEEFLKQRVVKGMKLEIATHGGDAAWRGHPRSKIAEAIARSAEEVTGAPCSKVLSGGSIPIVKDLIQELQVQSVGMGFGLPGDKIHAPNEHFDMKRLELGFLTFARTLANL